MSMKFQQVTEADKRVFSCLKIYFSNQQLNAAYKTAEIREILGNFYNALYPNHATKDNTHVYDGLRCIETIGLKGPISKPKVGIWKLKRFFIEDDKSFFNKNFMHFKKKGGAYENFKKGDSLFDRSIDDFSESIDKSTMKEENMQDNTSTLTKLGDQKTKYVYDNPTKDLLEVFENQYQNRDYVTEFVFNEFTSLCPKTGQPDFAVVSVKYIPGEWCIETKSLKMYFLSFRQHGSFMETITNRILEDCVSVCKPRWMKITSNFNARGGTLINVEAEHEAN